VNYISIQNYISKKRLEKYLSLADNDTVKAVNLYKLNIQYSSQIYAILSCFEVFFRNFVNNVMIEVDVDWIQNLSIIHEKILYNTKYYQKIYNNKANKNLEYFFTIQENLVSKTKERLNEAKKPINNSYLVAELTFGFWENLFNKNYETEIWNKYFQNKIDIELGKLEKEINSFRILRNRIAHNECILKYNLPIYIKRVFNILDLLDINLKDFIKEVVGPQNEALLRSVN
jgi:hypothetical protein